MSETTAAPDLDYEREAQRERLARDLQAIVAEAEALLKATAGATGAGSSELRSKVQASLDRAQQHLSELRGAAIERARAAGRATDQYVHDKPWQAIGAAAVVGLLVGLLIARR
ncbi:MAG: DUF883 family protein [Paucibacter sp.]|nr:DUF883 family protein [Roseateles sp.]